MLWFHGTVPARLLGGPGFKCQPGKSTKQNNPHFVTSARRATAERCLPLCVGDLGVACSIYRVSTLGSSFRKIHRMKVSKINKKAGTHPKRALLPFCRPTLSLQKYRGWEELWEVSVCIDTHWVFTRSPSWKLWPPALHSVPWDSGASEPVCRVHFL